MPNYNPKDVVDNLKRMMEGAEPEPMAPWYRGFTGSIVPADAKHSTFTTFGKRSAGLSRRLALLARPRAALLLLPLLCC